MTDEHSAENRPDSDLATGKRARRALPQLRLEWGQLRAQSIDRAVTSANAASPSDETLPPVDSTNLIGRDPPNRSLRTAARLITHHPSLLAVSHVDLNVRAGFGCHEITTSREGHSCSHFRLLFRAITALRCFLTGDVRWLGGKFDGHGVVGSCPFGPPCMAVAAWPTG
jgi:hypothetical protein